MPFRLEDERQRPAATLAHDDHDPALASLVASKTAVNAVLLPVGRLDVATEVSAVDLAGNCRLLGFGRNRLAKLVQQNERRLVLPIEVAGEL